MNVTLVPTTAVLSLGLVVRLSVASCVTVIVAFALPHVKVKVASLELLLVFSASETDTVPLPFPLVGLAVSQEALLETVHEPSLVTVTVRIFVFLPAPTGVVLLITAVMLELTFLTVTVTLLDTFGAALDVHVIVAVPTAFAVTKPEADTVATDVLLDVHVTLLSVALLGNTVAVSCCVLPFSSVKLTEDRVIDSGSTIRFTILTNGEV